MCVCAYPSQEEELRYSLPLREGEAPSVPPRDLSLLLLLPDRKRLWVRLCLEGPSGRVACPVAEPWVPLQLLAARLGSRPCSYMGSHLGGSPLHRQKTSQVKLPRLSSVRELAELAKSWASGLHVSAWCYGLPVLQEALGPDALLSPCPNSPQLTPLFVLVMGIAGDSFHRALKNYRSQLTLNFVLYRELQVPLNLCHTASLKGPRNPG